MEPIIAQRRDQDCGIAALAFYAHLRYEDVFVAAVRIVPTMVKDGGLSVEGLITVARTLGRRLERRHWRKVNLEEDVGILVVNWHNPKRHGGSHGHWVVLREGTIICPRLPSAWDADTYLLSEGGKLGTLLVEV